MKIEEAQVLKKEDIEGFGGVMKIAEEANRQRLKVKNDIEKEISASAEMRLKIAESDKKIGHLRKEQEDLSLLNHHEAALLLIRCKDYVDSEKRVIEDILMQAKNTRGQASNEKQQADDLFRKAKEQQALVESSGKNVFEKIRKAEEEAKRKSDELNRAIIQANGKKQSLEKEVELVSAMLEKKKALLAEAEKLGLRVEEFKKAGK